MGTPLSGEQKAVHFLNRVSFGSTPAETEKVKKTGIPSYLEEQLHPEKIRDSLVEEKLAQLKTIRLSSQELLELYPSPKQAKVKGMDVSPMQQGPRYVIFELQQAKLLRAVYSQRQLYEVMVDFWINHFNVFAGKGADRWLVTSYDRDTIRPHALGRFRDLLLATAKSPAMLFYLDNWLSVSPDAMTRNNAKPGARQGLNENYAREIMELHTLGVDGGYTQEDVVEVARCFTGWTIRRPRGEPEFVFNSRMHDSREKVVLRTRIPAGGQMEDGVKVIELLARHPSTARFIATKLVRRFVSDDPPESLVSQVANAFRDSDGDIKELLRVITRSPEFSSPEAVQAKVKKPLEFVASALRATEAETDASPALLRYLVRMAEPLFLSPPPTGFPDMGSTWVSPDMLLTRINFVIDLSSNRIPGTRASVDKETTVAMVAPEFQRR
jgi:uncharacterized protein (DUF1800 family)